MSELASWIKNLGLPPELASNQPVRSHLLHPLGERDRELIQKKRDHILHFATEQHFEVHTYDIGGRKLLLLELKDFEPINQQKIASYIGQNYLERDNISNNCFNIAERARQAGVATGKLFTSFGAQQLVGFGNHWINFDQLPDSVIGVDLTASNNIDENQGYFEVLAIRTQTLAELLHQLDNLYGGKWGVKEAK